MTGKASLLLRVVSKCIDMIFILTVAEVVPKFGWTAGFLYLLISDGLFEGSSLGKRLVGLRVLGAEGTKCSMRESILRNSTLALGLVLWKTPLIGWLLMTAVFVLEFIMLLGSRAGLRLGDEIAKTSVVETAEAIQES